ncbi:MAG: class I SAM-dependent methyltransferase [Dysgonamonadaceae bacterium]|jgi:23S rRNA (cytosine1962-C5)-methyltransferase|nr:class I SAM-dependent methyltransferase [Dysgonamonadaceae bacterium]
MNDYELIDTGGYEKLERFGKYVLRRPEPQAVWGKALPEADWLRSADAWFRKGKGKSDIDGNERGQWQLRPGIDEQWFVSYKYKDMHLRFRLGFTAFKHVGIFPEQASNWDFIYDNCRKLGDSANVLNLFAYTGGASMAARAAGAEVTHVDSVKPVLVWSKENMYASRLDNIRWICEDAMKFVNREVRRGSRYRAIILDPPAYGRGAEGEKWQLEEDIYELLVSCSKIADPDNFFCVLNLYSMGFSPLVAENLLKDCFSGHTAIESGELFLEDRAGRKLPLSVFGRTSKFLTVND